MECGLRRMRRRIREQKFEGMNKGELSHTQPTKPSQSLSSLSLSSSLPSLIIVVNHHCHHHYLHHHRHGDWKTQMLRNSASMFSDHAMLNLRSPPAPFSLIQKIWNLPGRQKWVDALFRDKSDVSVLRHSPSVRCQTRFGSEALKRVLLFARVTQSCQVLDEVNWRSYDRTLSKPQYRATQIMISSCSLGAVITQWELPDSDFQLSIKGVCNPPPWTDRCNWEPASKIERSASSSRIE